MAVSCDSFDETTNTSIGRGKGTHLETFVNLSLLCRKYNVKFKVNTVVCRYNFNEDMNAKIEQVAPFRWKCFQVLVVPGENDSSATLRVSLYLCPCNILRRVDLTVHPERSTLRHLRRGVRDLLPPPPTPEKLYPRVQRRDEEQLRPSPLINHSYVRGLLTCLSQLILDEYMRFLNKGVKEPTKSILEVGVPAAFDDVYWDDESFVKRGGEYDWQKEKKKEGSAYDF